MKVLRLALALLSLSMAACSRADMLPDLDSLKAQILKPDAELLRTVAARGEVQSFLLKLHPGALYYLAEGLSQANEPVLAGQFYGAAIDHAAPDWRPVIIRAWADTLRGAGQWAALERRGEGYLASLPAGKQGPAFPHGTEIWSAAESVYRGMVGAALARKDWRLAKRWCGEAEAALESPGIALGHDRLPGWLLRDRARVALALAAGTATERRAYRQAVWEYLFASEAREGHGQLASWLDGSSLFEAPERAGLSELAQAKSALSGQRAAEAWSYFRNLPEELGLWHQAAGLPPAMLLRDLYDAARLSGHLSDGISAVNAATQRFLELEAGWRGGSLEAYGLELAGRLARAKNDWALAQSLFGKAYRLALAAEQAGRLAREDRQRIQWYLLGSHVDAVDDLSGKLYDLELVSGIAARADDPEYFNDIFEEAVLKLGARGDWDALELWRDRVGKAMLPFLRHRVSTLLARSAQLGLAKPERATGRFQRYAKDLVEQNESLYYRMLGRWMRGEGLDLDSELASLGSQERFALPLSAARDPGRAALREIAQGYVDFGLWDAGMAFIWERREALGAGMLIQLGQAYVAAGEHRQGLRLLERVRMVEGHPADRARLAAFYPRPFGPAVSEAARTALLPEWLLYALVRTESSFDPAARSGPGAKGLAQLMPQTAAVVAARLRIAKPDLADPATNLMIGGVHVADLMASLGSWPEALAAYNAGAARVRSWLRGGLPDDPILFMELVPFVETRNYLRRITESALLYACLDYDLDAGSVLSILFTPGVGYRQ